MTFHPRSLSRLGQAAPEERALRATIPTALTEPLVARHRSADTRKRQEAAVVPAVVQALGEAVELLLAHP